MTGEAGRRGRRGAGAAADTGGADARRAGDGTGGGGGIDRGEYAAPPDRAPAARSVPEADADHGTDLPVGATPSAAACGCVTRTARRAGGSTPSAPARAALGLIRLYGLVLSPFLGRNCRYLPTCSAYGEEAIRRHGVWYGGFMTLARLCRCHPLGASGFDPVPQTLPDGIRWWTPWRAGRWGAGHIDPATRLDKP